MDSLTVLLGLGLLFGVLFLAEYLTRPRSAAWWMKRFTKHLDAQTRIIRARLTPALMTAATAVSNLAAVIRDDPDLQAALTEDGE